MPGTTRVCSVNIPYIGDRAFNATKEGRGFWKEFHGLGGDLPELHIQAGPYTDPRPTPPTAANISARALYDGTISARDDCLLIYDTPNSISALEVGGFTVDSSDGTWSFEEPSSPTTTVFGRLPRRINKAVVTTPDSTVGAYAEKSLGIGYAELQLPNTLYIAGEPYVTVFNDEGYYWDPYHPAKATEYLGRQCYFPLLWWVNINGSIFGPGYTWAEGDPGNSLFAFGQVVKFEKITDGVGSETCLAILGSAGAWHPLQLLVPDIPYDDGAGAADRLEAANAIISPA